MSEAGESTRASDGPGTVDAGALGLNAWLVEEMYQQYLAAPESVSESWQEFFADYRSHLPSSAPAAAARLNGSQPEVVSAPPAAAAPAVERAGPAPVPPVPTSAGPAAAPASAATAATAAPQPAAQPTTAPAPSRRTGRAGARLPASRRGRAHRPEHGRQPHRADRDERPPGPGEAARGQPPAPKRAPGPVVGRQGELHAPHRLGDRACARRGPGPQRLLRRGRRRQGDGRRRPPPPRGARHRDRPAQGRRRSDARRPRDQGRRHPRLRGLPPRLRGAGAQGPRQQAGGRRFRRRHRDGHEPWDSRDDPVGAAADAWPGGDRRRRRSRLPGGVRRDRPRLAGRARPRQGRHAHLDLRPPDHPGRRVRTVPQVRPRAAPRRARLLRRRLLVARGAAPADALAARPQPARERRPAALAPREAGPGAGARQHVPGAGPPHRPARPAVEPSAGAAQRPRPAHVRPVGLGPRPPLPHPRSRRPGPAPALAGARDPARRLLPDGRRRVHAHPESRREAVDPGARRRRVDRPVCGGAAPHPRPAERGGGVRALLALALRRPEALRPGGCRVDDPVPRRRARGGGAQRARGGRLRHGPSRPAERAGQHRRQVLRRDLRRVRGQPRPRVRPGLGRREVPQGRGGQVGSGATGSRSR